MVVDKEEVFASLAYVHHQNEVTPIAPYSGPVNIIQNDGSALFEVVLYLGQLRMKDAADMHPGWFGYGSQSPVEDGVVSALGANTLTHLAQRGNNFSVRGSTTSPLKGVQNGYWPAAKLVPLMRVSWPGSEIFGI